MDEPGETRVLQEEDLDEVNYSEDQLEGKEIWTNPIPQFQFGEMEVVFGGVGACFEGSGFQVYRKTWMVVATSCMRHQLG